MNLNESRVRIYNLALTKLGITQYLTLYTDQAPESKVFNQVWEQVVHEVLELADWRCARRRAVLQRDTDLVEAATQAEPVVITATGHAFENGDLVEFSDVVGMTELNGNTYMVKGVSSPANTFQLWTEDGTEPVDGTGFGAWSSGGKIWRIPNHTYAYAFKLPDDCLKVLESSVDVYGWMEEHNILITNGADTAVEILYLAYLSDPRFFSPLLADAVATRLAVVGCPALEASAAKQKDLEQEFSGLISLARGVDIRHRQKAEDLGSEKITEQ